MEKIRETWQSYLESVVPKNAGPVQLKETELSFLAGANSMFTIMLNLHTMSEEEAVKYLDSLSSELVDWSAEHGMMAGGILQ